MRLTINDDERRAALEFADALMDAVSVDDGRAWHPIVTAIGVSQMLGSRPRAEALLGMRDFLAAVVRGLDQSEATRGLPCFSFIRPLTKKERHAV